MFSTQFSTRTSLFVVALAAVLAGCTDSAVKTVQGAKYSPGSEFTIGEVFNNEQACDDTEWSSAENADGRMVVTVDCFRSISGDEAQRLAKAKVDSVISTRDSNLKVLQERMDAGHKHFARASAPKDDGALHEAQQTVEYLGPAVAELKVKYGMLEVEYTRTRMEQMMATRDRLIKMHDELAPMAEKLKKAEEVIARSEERQREVDAPYYYDVHLPVRAEDFKRYVAKEAEYRNLLQSNADGLVEKLKAYEKKVSGEKYGVSLDFVVLKSSAPKVSDGFYFIGSKEEGKQELLGFLYSLLDSPSLLGRGMTAAGEIMLKRGLDRIESNNPRVPSLTCFSMPNGTC